jgi:mRNA interferase MazF
MSYARGEVVLLPIPFTDLTSRKVRPAVVIGLAPRSIDLFVVPISSQLQNTDIQLNDWRGAGLNVACGIKAQIATVEVRLVVQQVGALSFNDRAALEQALRGWLQL